MGAADRTIETGGRPTCDREGPQNVRSEDQRGVVAHMGKGEKGADEEKILGTRPLIRVLSEFLSGFNHDGSARIQLEVGGERVCVDANDLNLRNDVEAAALRDLDVDDAEGLNSGTELRGGSAHSLRDCAHEPMLGGEQGDDTVRFTQFVGAQDDRLVTIGLHHAAIVSRLRGAGVRRHPRARLGARHKRGSFTQALVALVDSLTEGGQASQLNAGRSSPLSARLCVKVIPEDSSALHFATQRWGVLSRSAQGAIHRRNHSLVRSLSDRRVNTDTPHDLPIDNSFDIGRSLRVTALTHRVF